MYMKQKEWSSFRITLLLYIIVLILPFSFYFIYTSFENIQADTTVVRQSSWIAGVIEHIAVNPADPDTTYTIKNVDKALEDLSFWITINNNSDLYIGATTLSKEFSGVDTCWANYKEILSKKDDVFIKQKSFECYTLADEMALIIEKMVYLKQNKIINVFYLSLTLAMTLVLLMIYLVRTYIHKQIKKHAIHDHETKLFNKKYFCAEVKTSCARAERNVSPLSMLSMSIDDFEKGNKEYDKKTREHLLNILGELITSLTRTSDVACRYNENHFFILLPDTPEENALILEGRMRETFEKHDFGVMPELNFRFATTHFHYKELPETFITRIEQLLK